MTYKLFKHSDEGQVIVKITRENFFYNEDAQWPASAYGAVVVKVFDNKSVYKLGEECGPLKEYCFDIDEPNDIMKKIL